MHDHLHEKPLQYFYAFIELHHIDDTGMPHQMPFLTSSYWQLLNLWFLIKLFKKKKFTRRD